MAAPEIPPAPALTSPLMRRLVTSGRRFQPFFGGSGQFFTGHGVLDLRDAAALGSIPMLRYLLETRGSDVNAPATGPYGNGATALHTAAEHGQAEAVAFLLEAGAEVDKRNDAGATAFYLAAIYRQLSTVTLLVERGGADVDAAPRFGGTSLEYLCALTPAGLPPIILHLLGMGAHPWGLLRLPSLLADTDAAQVQEVLRARAWQRRRHVLLRRVGRSRQPFVQSVAPLQHSSVTAVMGGGAASVVVCTADRGTLEHLNT